jgi:hypothetical protein
LDFHSLHSRSVGRLSRYAATCMKRFENYLRHVSIDIRSPEEPLACQKMPIMSWPMSTLANPMLSRSTHHKSGDSTWSHLLRTMTQDPSPRMCLVVIGATPATDASWGPERSKLWRSHVPIACYARSKGYILRSILRLCTARTFSWATRRVAFFALLGICVMGRGRLPAWTTLSENEGSKHRPTDGAFQSSRQTAW